MEGRVPCCAEYGRRGVGGGKLLAGVGTKGGGWKSLVNIGAKNGNRGPQIP